MHTKLIHEIEIDTALSMLNSGQIWITEIGSENVYFSDRWNIRFFCKAMPQELRADLVVDTPRKQALYKTAYIPALAEYCSIKKAYASTLGYFYLVRANGWLNYKDLLCHENELARFVL